jgi:hypothetical protein
MKICFWARSRPQSTHMYSMRGLYKRRETIMNTRPALVTAATLLAAAAVPALGQTTGGPAEPANGGMQGVASIPDFSGLWARVSFPGFEPPLTGPGPVTNKLRSPKGSSSIYGYVGDHTNPILKPQAAEIVKKRGEIELDGSHAPSPRTQCWPGGVPFVFVSVGMQMFQQPNRITIYYPEDNQLRHVRMTEHHPVSLTPSWYGDSVAHYEGDTLVIDTVGVKIGPFAMVDVYGTPHSPALHVVERYRLLDYVDAKEAEERGEKENLGLPMADSGIARDPEYKGKGLQLQFTVEDEGVFTTPWSATVTYRRPSVSLGQWPELVCAENSNGYDGHDQGKKAAVPTADKPDF